MTNDELSALFSEFPAADADRQTQIMGTILEENQTVNDRLEQAQLDVENFRTQAEATQASYDKLRQQYVDRFLSGPPGDPDPGPDPQPKPKQRTFNDLFK